MLKLADNLSLPVDAVTQTFAILAKRRAGKSYAARRLTEQFFKAGQQVVIVDPKGDWWGIRASADGKSPGLPIVILGGERGDVPLEVGGGEVVAKLAAEERVSMLLDLSLLRKHEVATFMTAFLENLYRLKARETFRTPVMLMVDEADAVAPQKPQKGEERMLGAAEDIVRRGGQRGIGCTVITQRSAVLNKNVLTQTQVLVALRTIAPQDLAAMNAWIDVHGTEEQRKTLMESLPALPTGDAWFWSPGWPSVDGIFKRVHVLSIETFDSGATPKPGEKRREPKNIADVDLDALKRQMAATIERAKADDPKLLKSEIAKLKKELASKAPAPADDKAIERAKSAARAEALRESAEAIKERDRIIGTLKSKMGKAERHISDGLGFLHVNGEATPKVVAPQPVAVARQAAPVQRPRREPREAIEVGDVRLGKCERAVLTALYWLRDEEATQAKVAFYAGYSVTSSGFGNALSTLRTAGLLRGLRITSEGESLVESWDAGDKPTGQTLREWLRPKLGRCENTLLDTLCAAHPNTVPFGELSEQSGYSESSSGFGNALSTLRTIEAIEGYARDGGAKASDVFFE